MIYLLKVTVTHKRDDRPCSQQLCALVLLGDFFGWLFNLFWFRFLGRCYIYWLHIPLFTSNKQIIEMYQCRALEVYSMPVLYGWVESGSFGYFLEVKAAFSYLHVFFRCLYRALWLSERSRHNVFVNQWLNEFYLNAVYYIPPRLKIRNPWTTVYIVCNSFTFHVLNVTGYVSSL